MHIKKERKSKLLPISTIILVFTESLIKLSSNRSHSFGQSIDHIHLDKLITLGFEYLSELTLEGK